MAAKRKRPATRRRNTKRRTAAAAPAPAPAPEKLPPGTADQVERERRQLRVEQLARGKITQAEIGARLKAEGFLFTSQPVISRDMKEVRLRWKQERLELVDTEKDAGLEMLDHVQRLALEGFLKSCEDEVTARGGQRRGRAKAAKGETVAGPDEIQFAERKTKTRAGDATFLRVLTEVERIRGEWLGFEAPKVRRLDLDTALRKLAARLSVDPTSLPS